MRKHRYSRRVIGAEPLTGRDSELGVIRRALSGAGNHSGVVIAGAAHLPSGLVRRRHAIAPAQAICPSKPSVLAMSRYRSLRRM
jgi:hypothetical protein